MSALGVSTSERFAMSKRDWSRVEVTEEMWERAVESGLRRGRVPPPGVYERLPDRSFRNLETGERFSRRAIETVVLGKSFERRVKEREAAGLPKGPGRGRRVERVRGKLIYRFTDITDTFRSTVASLAGAPEGSKVQVVIDADRLQQAADYIRRNDVQLPVTVRVHVVYTDKDGRQVEVATLESGGASLASGLSGLMVKLSQYHFWEAMRRLSGEVDEDLYEFIIDIYAGVPHDDEEA